MHDQADRTGDVEAFAVSAGVVRAGWRPSGAVGGVGAGGADREDGVAAGLGGRYKRVWERLIKEGILKDVPDDLFIMGRPWREWLTSPESKETPSKSVDSESH